MRANLLALLALLLFAACASAAIIPGKSGTIYKDNPDFPPALLELAEVFWDHDSSGYADGDYYPLFVSDRHALDKRNPNLAAYLQSVYGASHRDAFNRNRLDNGSWAGAPPRAEYQYVSNALSAFAESRTQAPPYYSGTYKPTPTDLIRKYTQNPHWIKGMPFIYGGASIEDIYGFVEDAGWSGGSIEVIGDTKDVITFAVGYALYFALDIPGFYRGLYEKMLEGEKKKRNLLLRSGVYGPAGLVLINEDRTEAVRRVENISASHASGSGAWILSSGQAYQAVDGVAGKTTAESTGGWKTSRDDTILTPAAGSFDSAVIYWNFVLETNELGGGEGDFAGSLQMSVTDGAGKEHSSALAGANTNLASWSPVAGDKKYFAWAGVTTVKAGEYGTAKLKSIKLSSSASAKASKGTPRAVAYVEFYPMLFEKISMDLSPKTIAIAKSPLIEGDSVSVDGWVENDGDVDALDVLVVLKDNVTEVGRALLNISANTAAKASFAWKPSPGNHILSLEARSEGGEWGVPDANKSNNVLQKSFRVYAASEWLPDIAVTGIELSGLEAGKPATVTARFQNKGIKSSLGYSLPKAYLYVDGRQVGLMGEVLPLEPGASASLSLNHTFAFKECSAYKSTYYNVSVKIEPAPGQDADPSNNELSTTAAVSAPPWPDLTVSVSSSKREMKAGETTEITVSVGNSGKANSSMTDLKLFYVVNNERWRLASWLVPKMGVGEELKFYYNWSPSDKGDYGIEAEVDYDERVSEICEQNTASVPVFVESAYHNVSLRCWEAGSLKDACSASAEEGAAGFKQLTFYPEIGNLGTLSGTYRVTASLPQGWGGSLSKEVFTLQPKSGEAFRYFVTPPANAFGGNTTLTLSAALETNASVADNTTLTVFIPERFGANLSATSTWREVRVGESAVFDLTLENTGNTRNTEFFVWLSGELKDSANASMASAILSAGEGKSFTIAVTPPELTAGNYSLTVFAGTEEKTLANLTLTIMVKPFYDVSLSVPRAHEFVNLSSYFGRHAARFDFVVKVKSNADARVSNEVSNVPGGWLASVLPANYSVEAYTKARWRGVPQKAGNLYVGVFPDFYPPLYQPLAGNHTLSLTTKVFDEKGRLVKSIPQPLVVEVEQVHAVRAGFYAVYSALRNRTTPVYVSVTNLGNGYDDFNLTAWSASGWRVRVPNPRVRLAPLFQPMRCPARTKQFTRGWSALAFRRLTTPPKAFCASARSLRLRARGGRVLSLMPCSQTAQQPTSSQFSTTAMSEGRRTCRPCCSARRQKDGTTRSRQQT